MPINDSILRRSFADLDDVIADLKHASYDAAQSILKRLFLALDEEPLATFVSTSLPAGNFNAWWEHTSKTPRGMAGSGTLEWPLTRPDRVWMQIELARRLANGTIDLINFTHDFTNPYPSRKLTDHVSKLCAVVLEPMVRDLKRLAELRPVAPLLASAVEKLPSSGDPLLDSLLADACRLIREPGSASAQLAVEKLWDSWERLKTVRETGDKKASISAIICSAADSETVREMLERESRELTNIGNNFHIRHFETGKSALDGIEHLDYLFHRLFALVNLLLNSEQRRKGREG